MREEFRNIIIQSLLSTGYFNDSEVNDVYGKLYNLIDSIAHVNELTDSDISNRISSITNPSYFNKDYLANKILQFEVGKDVIVSDVNFEPGYDIVNESNRIIRNVSIELVNNIVEIKVAKGELNLISLTDIELAGLTTYIEEIILLGTRFNVTSGDANVLKFNLSIKVDDLILTSNSGEIVSVETGQEVLNEYIEDYIRVFNNESFDSEFQLIRFFDYLTSINGIVDVYVDGNAITRYDGLVETTGIRNISSTTGYFRVIAPDPDNAQSLTYTIL